ncbi:hypothetical protein ACGF13_25600 [Kitasatospora sp. NPDC048286]
MRHYGLTGDGAGAAQTLFCFENGAAAGLNLYVQYFRNLQALPATDLA